MIRGGAQLIVVAAIFAVRKAVYTGPATSGKG